MGVDDDTRKDHYVVITDVASEEGAIKEAKANLKDAACPRSPALVDVVASEVAPVIATEAARLMRASEHTPAFLEWRGEPWGGPDVEEARGRIWDE
jgi:hypothetical protein